MKRKEIIITIIAAVTAIAAIFMGTHILLGEMPELIPNLRNEKGSSEETVLTIWCTADNPYSVPIERLINKYNAEVMGRELYAKLTVFDSEEDMARAFDIEKPDIFLTDYKRSKILNDAGKLAYGTSSVSGIQYKTALKDMDPYIGQTIFPLGVCTQLLVCEKGLYETPPITLAALFKDAQAYGAENIRTYIYVEDFSELFCRAVKERGGSFQGNYKDSSDQYKTIYNYIGGAAYSYGVECGPYDALSLIKEGYVKCAIVSSLETKDLDIKEFDVFEVPQAGETKHITGTIYCMAMPAEAKTTRATSLLKWLSNPARLQNLALDCHCVPVITLKEFSGTTYEQILVNISNTSVFYTPKYSSNFYANRDLFNESFRSMIETMKRQ